MHIHIYKKRSLVNSKYGYNEEIRRRIYGHTAALFSSFFVSNRYHSTSFTEQN